jgi:hypothetical protein
MCDDDNDDDDSFNSFAINTWYQNGWCFFIHKYKHFDSCEKNNLAHVQRVLIHTALHCTLMLTAVNRKVCPKIMKCCVYVVTKEHVCVYIMILVVTGEFVADGLLYFPALKQSLGCHRFKGYRDVQTVVAMWLTTELMTRYQPEGTENLAYCKINARNVRRRCGKLVG